MVAFNSDGVSHFPQYARVNFNDRARTRASRAAKALLPANTSMKVSVRAGALQVSGINYPRAQWFFFFRCCRHVRAQFPRKKRTTWRKIPRVAKVLLVDIGDIIVMCTSGVYGLYTYAR